MIKELERLPNEDSVEYIKRLVYGKLRDGTLKEIKYEDLSELIFGEGNCYNESEVRKRMYGMKHLFEMMDTNTYNIATRILSISDTHVPFQLPIETFKDYVGRVDILQLNGDIVDNQAISKFPKSYRISMMEEMIQGRQYIIDLIEYIKPKKVSINFGNHEMRFQAYLAKNLDSDLLELMPQTALDLIINDGFHHYDKRNKTKVYYEPLNKVFTDIEVEYTGNWYSKIGQTIFAHPIAYSTGIMKTAEKAMYWFRNEGFDFTSLILAHTHRTGEYTIGNTTIYEQGACCDTKSNNYSDGKLYNSQKQGFIYVCQDKDGKLLRDKTQLVVLN